MNLFEFASSAKPKETNPFASLGSSMFGSQGREIKPAIPLPSIESSKTKAPLFSQQKHVSFAVPPQYQPTPLPVKQSSPQIHQEPNFAKMSDQDKKKYLNGIKEEICYITGWANEFNSNIDEMFHDMESLDSNIDEFLNVHGLETCISS